MASSRRSTVHSIPSPQMPLQDSFGGLEEEEKNNQYFRNENFLF